ncbi:MAG: amidophosphoribosyltransferase [Dysgonamonadaceae bacterium]|jgi:hypothetical protein|nr:amidophosphoribosyltransferase [Dysgonamonadaceae bacterium]
MNKFPIHPDGRFLTIPGSIDSYYNCDYTGMGNAGNPDFLNHLKNQFNRTNVVELQNNQSILCDVLQIDLNLIKGIYSNINLTICVVPRAKEESFYSTDQKLFRQTVSNVVNTVGGYSDGTNYILRHTNTRTTHLDRSGYGGDGDLPYPGITKDTCNISNAVRGKDILLIDDIYTAGIYIDEDAIQALFDNGVKNVYFYAVGKTVMGL